MITTDEHPDLVNGIELYNRGWNEALEEVFNKLHASYFVDGKPALVIYEDNSQRPAMPEIFELLNTLKK